MIEIPSKYTINAYLRENMKKVNEISSFFINDFLVECRSIYKNRPINQESINLLSDHFLEKMKNFGVFSITEEKQTGNRNLPHRQRHDIMGFFVEPITMGHIRHGEVDDGRTVEPYLEQAALLRTINCSFRRKRASFGVGFPGLALTRHVLERIFERTEISRDDFPSMLANDLNELLQGLAVARDLGIASCDIDSDDANWITAVPFSNGIIIIKLHFLVGEPEEGDFGFLIEVPAETSTLPYTSPNRIVGDQLKLINQKDRDMATVDCGVTYLNLLTLGDSATKYYYKFQNLKDLIGDDLLSRFAAYTFNPKMPHEPDVTLRVNDSLLRIREELTDLLDSGWIKPKREIPMSLYLPYDYKI